MVMFCSAFFKVRPTWMFDCSLCIKHSPVSFYFYLFFLTTTIWHPPEMISLLPHRTPTSRLRISGSPSRTPESWTHSSWCSHTNGLEFRNKLLYFVVFVHNMLILSCNVFIIGSLKCLLDSLFYIKLSQTWLFFFRLMPYAEVTAESELEWAIWQLFYAECLFWFGREPPASELQDYKGPLSYLTPLSQTR